MLIFNNGLITRFYITGNRIDFSLRSFLLHLHIVLIQLVWAATSQ